MIIAVKTHLLTIPNLILPISQSLLAAEWWRGWPRKRRTPEDPLEVANGKKLFKLFYFISCFYFWWKHTWGFGTFLANNNFLNWKQTNFFVGGENLFKLALQKLRDVLNCTFFHRKPSFLNNVFMVFGHLRCGGCFAFSSLLSVLQ